MEDKNGKLGLWACIAVIVGGCIGSAIFSLSGMTMYYAGPAAIVSWIIAAAIYAIYGMQVCELAVRFPQSGGIFVFPQKAIGEKKKTLGDILGFISAWGYICSNVIAVSFSAIYVATYLGMGFSFFADKQILLAVIAVLLCFGLNLLKITDAGKFNNILVLALALAMLLFSFTAIFGGSFDISRFTPFFSQGLKGSGGFISAIPIAAVAYGACVSIAFMVGEVKNPNRTIPLSLAIGIVIVMVLYLLMLVGTQGNLDTAILLDDENAFFRYVPMFAAIWTSKLGSHAWLAQLISVSALFALLTTMLVLSALNARAIQAVARGGFFAKGLAGENRNGVPANAAALSCALSVILAFMPEQTEILVGLGALLSVVSMVITCVSLIVARKNHPENAPGVYRAPGKNILPVITIAVLTLCYVPDIITGSVRLLIFTLAIYAFGLIIYSLCKKRNTR